MRLGFAIATQVDPDVLIVDEALSVGDGYFQKKCMDKILAFVERGKTLLFCSHAMYYVSALCEHALWLRGGRVEAFGPPRRSYGEYEALSGFAPAFGRRADKGEQTAAGAVVDAPSSQPVRLKSIVALDKPAERPTWKAGERVRFAVSFRTDDPARMVHIGALLETEQGTIVASFGSNLPGTPPFSGRTEHEVVLEIPGLPLVRGTYNLTLLLLDERGLHVYDRRYLRQAIFVESGHFDSGFVHIPVPVDRQLNAPAVSLSIVVPAFREQARIGRSLDALLAWSSGRAEPVEIIVVDDGSDDGTVDVVDRYVARGVRLIRLQVNRGKGAALRAGVAVEPRAAGFFSPTPDLSTPITEITLLEAALENADVAIGSRALAASRITERQPLWREGAGKLFNGAIRLLGVRGSRTRSAGSSCSMARLPANCSAP